MLKLSNIAVARRSTKPLISNIGLRTDNQIVRHATMNEPQRFISINYQTVNLTYPLSQYLTAIPGLNSRSLFRCTAKHASRCTLHHRYKSNTCKRRRRLSGKPSITRTPSKSASSYGQASTKSLGVAPLVSSMQITRPYCCCQVSYNNELFRTDWR
jgi:hypothetical protein